MRLFVAILFLGFLPILSVFAEKSYKEMRVPLRFQTNDNLSVSRGIIRLSRSYIQKTGKSLCFEAEEASTIELQSSDKRIMKSDEASNGYYVHYAKKLEFNFNVATPGTYQVYYRSWFPIRGSYNHHEVLDDGASQMVIDSPRLDPKQWHWVKGPVYTLSKGEHCLRFPSPAAFCAGARLDKIVLSLKGSTPPKGKGPKASPNSNSDEGTAVTRRVKLKRIHSWRLVYAITPNGGKVEVEFSFNKTDWKKVPQSDEYITVPVPKPAYIYFRVSIHGKKNGISPQVNALKLMIEKE